MTVIVRVAGWLLFGFHVHKTQQFVNSVQEKAKFSQHYCPPPHSHHQPSGSFQHSQRRTKGPGLQCVILCRRGPGVGDGGCRGFPSVVRTPSVPHFQLPIFIFQKFLCFLHFLLLFVYARNLGTYYRRTLAISTHAHLSNN